MDKNILFPYRDNNLIRILNSEVAEPHEFMYGTYELLKEFPEIAYFNSLRGVRNTLLRKCLWPFETLFVRLIKLGIPFEMYLENKQKIDQADRIFCTCDAISFSMLFWKRFNKIDAKVYTLFQSLSERYKYFRKNPVAKYWVRGLLLHSDKIMVLSSAAKKELSRNFNIPLSLIEVFYFGADLNYWSYKAFPERQRDYILTVGNDMNRDFKTLTHALAGKYKIVAVTNKSISHPGIRVKRGISNQELMNLYQNARLVITPSIKLLSESSGLSTTLQAMACGAPVLISDSLPMRELFKEDEHIFYYKPENSESLFARVNKIFNDQEVLNYVSQNARSLIEEKYNSENMSLQLKKILM